MKHGVDAAEKSVAVLQFRLLVWIRHCPNYEGWCKMVLILSELGPCAEMHLLCFLSGCFPAA